MTDSPTPTPVNTVVVSRESSLQTTTTLRTEVSVPDIVVKVMSPLAVVLVRATRVYLQTAMGLMAGGAIVSTGVVGQGLVPAGVVIASWKVALGLSVGPALVCAGQNALELLARLDEKLPQLRP